MTDHARSFTRPLLRFVGNRQNAYVEILAMRAQSQPDLAEHLMTASEALEKPFLTMRSQKNRVRSFRRQANKKPAPTDDAGNEQSRTASGRVQHKRPRRLAQMR